MRHRKKTVKTLTWWAQKWEIRVRNLLTSLVNNGQIKTTEKKARVLESQGNKFFSRLTSLLRKYDDENEVRREAIRIVKSTIYTKDDWKKVVDELLPKYREENRTSGFIQCYKLGYRQWDWAEEVLVKLV